MITFAVLLANFWQMSFTSSLTHARAEVEVEYELKRQIHHGAK
jgi:hypothetical protein